jgi:undecaprenyl-diphosphatase
MAWEEAFLLFLQDIRTEFLNPIMRFFSFLGNSGWLWIVICILLLIYKPTRPIGIIATVTLLVSAGICNGLLKQIVNRTRPYDAIEELRLIAKKPHDSSFPSGHSNASFAVACAITWCLTKKRKWVGVILIVIAALIAFSRLYVGAHYPTDVIVGVLLGIICSIVIYQVLHKKVLKNNELDENELEQVESEGING